MLVWCHSRQLVGADARGRGPQDVGAFHGSPDSTFGDNGKDAGVDEAGDMPIQASGRNIGQLGPKLGRRQRTVSEERLDDPQADGMQEQISAGHTPTIRVYYRIC